MTIDGYSFASHLIEMKLGGVVLASATGFIYRGLGPEFLITNWHNVTGRDPVTLKALPGGEPDRIDVHLHGPEPSQPGPIVTCPLFDDEDEPAWLEHPDRARGIDVAAVPISTEPGAVLAINEVSSMLKLAVHVGTEVFVLGFPFRLSASGLPIWKRASIASEPDIDLDGLPKLLVDTASRPGMSGSPVILRHWGNVHDRAGQPSSRETGSRFLGIYSGRVVAADPLEAQLGIVWKARVIDEMIATKQRGQAIRGVSPRGADD